MPNTPRQAHRPTGRLVLADGSVFTGRAFGATGRGLTPVAEVVFNTALTGYQESMTDPSYSGQILVLTTPLIGNTGVNAEDVESARVQISGLVVRELAQRHSNYRATDTLDRYLADADVLALEGIDTRALTRRLRSVGVMNGVLCDSDTPTTELLAMARAAASMAGANLVPAVACRTASRWGEDLGDWDQDFTLASSDANRINHNDTEPTRPLRVLALDCGAKRNILRNLAERACQVEVIPHTTTADEILRRFDAGEFDGLFVSNGPGDPAAVEQTIATLRRVVAREANPVPTFGICLGHQLLALAIGAKTYKLPFGHRGTNQPVRDTRTGRVEITSQNHGFAVDPDSLAAAGGSITHVHLNDGTVAGFRLANRPVFSVQYHPEASPGPHDSSPLFDEFVRAMRAAKRGPRF
ncbi:MAG: glutamine-hydrolyzing carbamoyl-phosphate synthase small subunit [Phycisphaeraceae bacterium]|nr:glutamine-hydrolyzing carbamoyl-phosphate synthase small subunit [Phycisphaeraceae bacterium]